MHDGRKSLRINIRYYTLISLVCQADCESEDKLNKRKLVTNIIGRVLGIILLVLAVFLAITAMTFSFGGGKNAPDIFGFNIYIVKGGDFYQLKNGTAAMAVKAWPDEVFPDEIILYRLSENDPVKLARVHTATLKEAVMSYEVETEDKDIITLSQGQYIAKVTHCSDIVGGFINFATSPFGLMTIAILPCIAIAVFELVKFIISKLPSPEVETIKIQEETPTFVPKKDIDELAVKREQEKQQKKELAAKQKILTPSAHSQPESASKTEDFTERLKRSDRIRPHPVNAEEVKDRPDFSAAAKKHMEQQAGKAEKKEQEPAADKSEKRLSAVAVAEKAEKTPAKPEKAIPTIQIEAVKEEKAPVAPSDAPDISMVFSDDDDEGYDIDDILADIAKKHK